MPPKIPHVHDKFIKELLADREVAIAFLSELLPQSFLQLIKTETLVQEQTSYLSTELEETFSDIVWRVETHTQPLKICLLLEHKSYKDPHVVFQLLEYLAQGYRQQIKTHAKTPQLIVPILYYHGKTTWKLKLLDDVFSHYPPEFQKYLPHYQPEFIDLSLQSTEQLISLRNGMLASALLIQRHYFDTAKLTANVVNIFKSLSPYLDKSLSNSIFVYLIQFLDLSEGALLQELEQAVPPEINDKLMSLYDQLLERGRKEGRQKGIQEGIEEGRQKGIEEGIEKTILNAYANGISLDVIRAITGESLEKIQAVLKQHNRL